MAKARGTAGRRKFDSHERTVVPLYHQVYVVLRERIRDGEYDAAEPLPGEHQLAEEFGVSRVTIRRTLNNLELDGLVEKRRGVGTFVTPNPAVFRDRYNIGGLLQSGSRNDAPTMSKNLRMGMIDPPRRVIKTFGSQDRVFRLERLRHVNGEPFTLLTAYLPEPVSRRVSRERLKQETVLVAIEDAGFYLARTEQAISARPADERRAELLHQPVGASLIFMTSLFADPDDEPVVLLEAYYRPDMYEYRTTMLRRGRGESARWQPLL